MDDDSGRFYSNMYNRRQEGDYTDIKKYQNVDIKDFKFAPVQFRREEVEEWIKNAKIFIDKIERLIYKLLKEQ